MAYQPLPPVGQDDMAGSLPVVIASDQSPIDVDTGLTTQTDALTDTQLRATPVPVSGTVTANLGTLNGAATTAKQDTIIGHVDGIETTLGTIDTDTGAIATSAASIDTKTPALGQALAAASVPVILPAATITTLTPQTDALTDTQLRATAVPVSATDLDIRPLVNTDVVTAELSAVDNAVLDDIAAKLATIDADTGNLAVVGGGTEAAAIRVTIANNSTGVLSVDDNGSSLSIDDGGNVITVDGTVGVTGVSTLAEQQTQTTALQLLDDAVATLGTTTYTEATTKGYTIGAVRRDADTTLVNTTNEIGPLQMDANGRLKVEVFSGETLPVSGTVTANLAAGTNNIGDVDVLSLPALPAGNNNIGDVDVASIAAGSNTIGGTYCVPNTTGGLATFNATSSDGGTALTNSAQAIKASAGQLFGWYIYNPNAAAVAYVQLYNTASASVTVGTTSPLFMLAIPAGSAANVFNAVGITFSNAGWSCAATSTAGGNGALGTAVDAVFFYK